MPLIEGTQIMAIIDVVVWLSCVVVLAVILFWDDNNNNRPKW